MIQIRPFRPDDLPVLQSIRTGAFKPIHDSFHALLGEDVFRLEFADWDRVQGDYLQTICASRSNKEVYVATTDGAIVGFIGLSMNRTSGQGEIDLNAVESAFQGMGVGEAMYRFAIDRMRREGITIVKVSTGGDESHAPARRAYEKVGFDRRIPSVTMYQKLGD